MIKLSNMNLTEYDERQINLMKELLGAFTINKLSFRKLIDDLRGLLDCLQSVDMDWKELFYEHWFTLEQVYAVASFRNEELTSNDPDILDAINQLKALLES